ncbi:MAG: hypothetical protein Greene07144_970 [Parcubacteria group bacterium Greene0714_4]|nr:MAG: hypothetical protein Greene07144_970 [Parcubacteria group bacterium Greene0714_4]
MARYSVFVTLEEKELVRASLPSTKIGELLHEFVVETLAGSSPGGMIKEEIIRRVGELEKTYQHKDFLKVSGVFWV